VVDSADTERFGECASELHKVLSHENMANVPVLVYANKQDLPSAKNPQEMVKVLELDKLERKWYVQASIAKNKTGLAEGLDWLNTTLG